MSPSLDTSLVLAFLRLSPLVAVVHRRPYKSPVQLVQSKDSTARLNIASLAECHHLKQSPFTRLFMDPSGLTAGHLVNTQVAHLTSADGSSQVNRHLRALLFLVPFI